jgi:putative oxidoreductase
MTQTSKAAIIAARILVALVFLINGLGIIDQSEALRELIQRGCSEAIAPGLLIFGRSIEVIAGIAFALGKYPRIAAVWLMVFLIPATWVGHPFWLLAGAPTFTPQLINFFKNIAMLGGLLFVASIDDQPTLLRMRNTQSAPRQNKRTDW